MDDRFDYVGYGICVSDLRMEVKAATDSSAAKSFVSRTAHFNLLYREPSGHHDEVSQHHRYKVPSGVLKLGPRQVGEQA